jgi:hypothetical protein
MEIQINRIYKTKEDFLPLFRKGDRFKILKLNEDINLMPIEALRLKDGKIYGFEENEFEELKQNGTNN